MPPPIFLNISDVLQIHHHQIERYGGDSSLRDMGLLESALATPAASFGGELLHEFPHGMAAAYLFHIAKNHAFVDGNKRTALVACLVFLELNGYGLDAEKADVEDVVLKVASSGMSKDDLIEWMRLYTRRAAR